MLKFSGFADLTSCLESHRRVTIAEQKTEGDWTRRGASKYARMHDSSPKNRQGYLHALDVSKAYDESRSTLTHNDTKIEGPTHRRIGDRNVRPEEEVGTLKQACFQGYPESAFYVQGSIDSRKSAIHNAYHSSLCPSSLFEPRHSSLKVVRRNAEAMQEEMLTNG